MQMRVKFIKGKGRKRDNERESEKKVDRNHVNEVQKHLVSLLKHVHRCVWLLVLVSETEFFSTDEILCIQGMYFAYKTITYSHPRFDLKTIAHLFNSIPNTFHNK